jgi:hypothetical protein
VLVNADTISPTAVLVTDTLPFSLTYIPGSLNATGGRYDHAGGVITWTGTITAAERVTITYGVTLSAAAARPATIVNTTRIAAGGVEIERTAVVDVPPAHAYLPLARRAPG